MLSLTLQEVIIHFSQAVIQIHRVLPEFLG